MANDHEPRTRKKLNHGREPRGVNLSRYDISGLIEKGLDLTKVFRGKKRRQRKMKQYG